MSSRSDDAADRPLSTQPSGTLVFASQAASFVIDGVALPERLVAEEAQNHPAATPEAARAAAAHALAIKALLLDRAHQLGLTPRAEQDEDGREETPEEALVRAVLEVWRAARPLAEIAGAGLADLNQTQNGAPEPPTSSWLRRMGGRLGLSSES